MSNGTAKLFNSARGFGFIVPDDLSPEVFVHFSAIEISGHRELTEGQRGTFDAVSGAIAPTRRGSDRSEG
jgi:CspA family cold shock protein